MSTSFGGTLIFTTKNEKLMMFVGHEFCVLWIELLCKVGKQERQPYRKPQISRRPKKLRSKKCSFQPVFIDPARSAYV